MEHQIAINYKGIKNPKILELYRHNYYNDLIFTPKYRYNIILNCDYWFVLYNSIDNNIIAECMVTVENINVFEITDVYVNDIYRGNNYSVLLILNVLYYFNNKRTHLDKLHFTLRANITNISAITCYNKIFGEPYKIDNEYYYYKAIEEE